MAVIRNLLALLGFLGLLAGGVGYVVVAPVMGKFDPEFMGVYSQFAQKLLETGDPGSTMVYSVPVKEGISVEDVKESLKSLAAERNFLFVGESPFYKQVEATTGKPYRHVSFMSFCDVKVGRVMADYNDVYTAFMPCRVSVVEDKAKPGKYWLHTMSLDMMIHGGKELPPELKRDAQRIWKTIQEIMNGAATGQF
ncbi:MAG: DUF302 domain-containing protein [Magnetococcales bacterium]|nr:DUF302 domain-containing protein [Magnetococcales bacterium]MBF0322305.1 DUF302 domain-containing protein [Magnetococcales bacterium]